MRFAANSDNDEMHTTTNSIRTYVAVDIERPTPVPKARYAARHAGHFGSSARIALGTIHPAMSRHRRVNVAGAAIVSRESLPATTQQR